MKNYTIILFATLCSFNTSFGQDNTANNNEKYGHTVNAAVGAGYFGYIGHATTVLLLNYEFDVAKNLTLAPFIGYYSFENRYYWGNSKYAYRDYSYSQTVMPVGVKGSYYFDQLLGAGTKWDFYLAGSLGVVFRSTTWEYGYYGETMVHRSPDLYLDIHIGTEYHLNNKVGLTADLSSGVFALGVAVHLAGGNK
jgi:hypothetical protein